MHAPHLTALSLTAAAAAIALAGCGGGSAGPAAHTAPTATHRTGTTPAAAATTAGAKAAQPPAPPAAPPLRVMPLRAPGSAWRAVARVHGHVAAWLAQRGGTTLLRFDQRYVRLDLHAGDGEPEGPWRYGGQVQASETHHLIAAFNGGFKFSTGDVGWSELGRVAAPLRDGHASIVTYRDGTSEIGAWHDGVPAPGRAVYSVLQNLSLLVAGGAPATNAAGCVQSCWGATVGNVDVVARSALGETAGGQLVWAAGEHLTPLSLAHALIAAGARTAIELDINPDWVAGYLYSHGPEGPQADPLVPGQNGVPGEFLQAYTRDFFAVVAR